MDPRPRRQKNHLGGGESQGKHQVLKPPPITRSISNKERGGPSKRMPSLEEPSPITTACLKIDIVYTCCSTTDTLCL
jgi:hypothetical protein